jgi:hypothetical protein
VNDPLQILRVPLELRLQTKSFAMQPKKIREADQSNVDGLQLTDVWNN